MTAQQQLQRPRPGMMIGLSHSSDGLPIIRQVKTLKVGIGIPKGRAVVVSIEPNADDPKKKWCIRFGQWEKQQGGKDKLTMPIVHRCETADEAEKFYRSNRQKAAIANRPQKIAFFTFLKKVPVTESGKLEEYFEPDFQAIEAHGAKPTELDVILFSDEPLGNNEYAMYSQSEKQCYGDGEIGMRVLSLARGKDEQALAEEAKKSGDKYFPILTGCATGGCEYYAASKCKPGLTAYFQLSNCIRIGATAFFATTSIRSCAQINSGIADLKQKAGGRSIVGVPVKLVLSPFRSNHDGIAALQYGVHIELRAEDTQKLKALLSSSWDAERPAMRQISAPVESEVIDITPAEMAAEFYVQEDDDDDSGPAPQQAATSAPVAEASRAKVGELAERLRAEKAKTATAPTASVTPPATTAPPATASGSTPWPDERTMMTAMRQAKAKIGDIKFQTILRDRNISMGEAKFNDPCIYAAYGEMVQLARSEHPAPTPTPVPQNPAPVATTPTSIVDDGKLF